MTEDDKRRIREMFEEFGYDQPDEPTIEEARIMLADVLNDPETTFTLDQIDRIADAIFEELPPGEDDGEEEDDSEGDEDEGDEP